jgi:threonine/homoserine/homoserine lactone efflux protein
VAVSLLVDVTRLSFYQTNLATLKIPYELLIVGVLSALAGSILGKLLLERTTMKVIQKIVGLALIILGVSILTGLI